MYVISDMMRVSLAQFVLTFLVASLFAVFVGQEAGVSALIGGIAYAFPTALFALYLVTAGRRTSGRFSPYRVLVGEFVKILAVLLILGLSVKYYENLYWPGWILGIVVVVNANFIVLFKRN